MEYAVDDHFWRGMNDGLSRMDGLAGRVRNRSLPLCCVEAAAAKRHLVAA